MLYSENASESYSNSSVFCYFNVLTNNRNRFALHYTYIPEPCQPIPAIAKMVLMTDFDSFGTAKR